MRLYNMLFFVLLLSFVMINVVLGITKRAFYITKNKHPNNIVCYDVRLKDGCRIDTNSPLDVYWILGDTGGGKREGLSFLERKLAYGVYDLKVFSPYKISFRLRGKENIKIYIEVDATRCIPITYVFIKGKKVVFESMFFKLASGGGLIPKVEYLEFVMRDRRVRLLPNEF
jgi:hypothetical protein